MHLRFSLPALIFLVIIIIIVDLLLSKQGPVQPIKEKQAVIVLHAAPSSRPEKKVCKKSDIEQKCDFVIVRSSKPIGQASIFVSSFSNNLNKKGFFDQRSSQFGRHLQRLIGACQG